MVLRQSFKQKLLVKHVQESSFDKCFDKEKNNGKLYSNCYMNKIYHVLPKVYHPGVAHVFVKNNLIGFQIKLSILITIKTLYTAKLKDLPKKIIL